MHSLTRVSQQSLDVRQPYARVVGSSSRVPLPRSTTLSWIHCSFIATLRRRARSWRRAHSSQPLRPASKDVQRRMTSGLCRPSSRCSRASHAPSMRWCMLATISPWRKRPVGSVSRWQRGFQWKSSGMGVRVWWGASMELEDRLGWSQGWRQKSVHRHVLAALLLPESCCPCWSYPVHGASGMLRVRAETNDADDG